MRNKPSIVLVTAADDRQGRKGGQYTATQHKITRIMSDLIRHVDYGIHTASIWAHRDRYERMIQHADPGLNGRCYKPMAILKTLHHLDDGDFLIYNDCSPELWHNAWFVDRKKIDLRVIQNLTESNDDILTSFVKWDFRPIKGKNYGMHVHKFFTTNLCMDMMGLRQYEMSYMHASGMICIRKTAKTVKFVEEWLHWNLDPRCASLGDGDASYFEFEKEFKLGHRHDQSISGLLLNERNAKLVDIVYNDLNPYNFLNYCLVDHDYQFIDSNHPVDTAKLDLKKVFIRRGSTVQLENGLCLKVWAVNGEEIIVGQFEESCWATTRDKLTLV